MLYLKMHFLKGGLKWTWRCWPCSWIIDATCIGRIVWWSFVLLNFTYSSLCMYLQLKKDLTIPALIFFNWRVPRTAYLLLRSCFKYVYPWLVFCIKRTLRRTLYCSACWNCVPLIFYFLEYIKQLILLYLIFFCKLFGFV